MMDSHNIYRTHSAVLQTVAVLSATLMSVSVGMNYGWTSPSLPLLMNENSKITTTSSDGSWIAAMPFAGLLLGCFIAPVLVDKIGRKTSLLVCSPIAFVSWVIIAFAPNVLYLKCARFLGGILDGIVYTTLTIYIGEMSNKKIRGFLCCLDQVAFKSGILAVNIIGLQFDIKSTALIASAIPVLHLITFVWMPESPHFLYRHDTAPKLDYSSKTTSETKPFNQVPSTTIQQSGWWKRFRFINIMNNKVERKALFIMCGLLVVQYCSGCLAIAFYCLTIFIEAGGAIDASTSTIIYFGVQIIVAPLSGVLADRVGRRPLLIISAIGSGCALTIVGIYFYLKSQTSVDLTHLGFVPLTALVLYIVKFSIGLDGVPRLLLAELFPTRSKAIAVSVINFVFAVLVLGVSKLFQIVKDEFGMHIPFFGFAICCACGLIFIVYCVPETKGKTLEQIQADLAGVDSNENEFEDL